MTGIDDIEQMKPKFQNRPKELPAPKFGLSNKELTESIEKSFTKFKVIGSKRVAVNHTVNLKPTGSGMSPSIMINPTTLNPPHMIVIGESYRSDYKWLKAYRGKLFKLNGKGHYFNPMEHLNELSEGNRQEFLDKMIEIAEESYKSKQEEEKKNS